MIRQARNYLLGALSGAGLIAVAVVAFVLLVSAQVFEDWPIADLVGAGDDEAAVSVAQPAAAGPGVAAGATALAGKAGPGGGPAKGGGDGSSGGGAAALGGEGVTGSGQQPGTPTGGGGGGEAGGGGSATTTSTSAQVTSTVNETANQVDQTVTGGALEETGVTQVTEETVNGVAGPESTVGKVVDETARTVEGVLGGK